MIQVIIRMNVIPAKREELSQTIASLIVLIRRTQGCMRCDLFQSMGDENELCFIEEWDNERNLKRHMGSDHFQILQGAMSLLQKPSEVMFHTGFQPARIENI